ncbi:DUF192 domain-containing protein [Candidatus Saccharibacteria bacterium]|nr:DUF192 domain-containing protein [Candidatus Saccharibacteria bacterium]
MIVSALKAQWRLVFVVAFFLFCALFVPFLYEPRKLEVGSQLYNIQYANTPAKREKGLSNRDSLPDDTAMIFDFGKPGKYCIWMKDMNFPIDILWVNADGQVIELRQNVLPDSYPESFCPADDASYVIELKAGEVARSGISEGERVRF